MKILGGGGHLPDRLLPRLSQVPGDNFIFILIHFFYYFILYIGVGTAGAGGAAAPVDTDPRGLPYISAPPLLAHSFKMLSTTISLLTLIIL